MGKSYRSARRTGRIIEHESERQFDRRTHEPAPATAALAGDSQPAHGEAFRRDLYHGGKFNARWIDPDRSRELISKALLILETLVPLHKQLSEAIQGNQA
jgi:hypothetical protein